MVSLKIIDAAMNAEYSSFRYKVDRGRYRYPRLGVSEADGPCYQDQCYGEKVTRRLECEYHLQIVDSSCAHKKSYSKRTLFYADSNLIHRLSHRHHRSLTQVYVTGSIKLLSNEK